MPRMLAGDFLEQKETSRCSEWQLPVPTMHLKPSTCTSENCFSQPTDCKIAREFGSLGSMCLRSGPVAPELLITSRPDGESGPTVTTSAPKPKAAAAPAAAPKPASKAAASKPAPKKRGKK